MRRARGFTLVELATTLGLAAALVALAAPSLTNTVSVSKAKSVVSRMTQDYLWARGRAAAGSMASIRFVLNADCSWTTMVDDTVDAAHSFDAAQIAQTAGHLSCTGLNGSALPLTFTFDVQGMVLPAAQFSYTAVSGQSWPFRVLGSGTIIHTAGTS